VAATVAGTLLALAGACRDDDATPRTAPPGAGERLLVTSGHLQAGNPVHPAVHNPLEDDANARAQGRQLFVWFNCAGCHGPNGGGGMGPPLLDKEWIYGNSPAEIFQSVAQGRPNGMPAFGGKVPDEHIWRIELFVRSLGGVDSTLRAGASSGMSPTEAQRRTGSGG
jgi:cytochrome c oxidase cbb3-type subunit 3